MRIPAERYALWPLRRMERGIVNAVNLALNPLLFIAMLFAALSRHRAVGVGLLASGIVAPFAAYALRFFAGRVRRVNRFSILRIVPRFPGRLGGLVQNHVREQLRMIDVYFAAALSIGGAVYRFFDRSAGEMALLVIGHLVVIVMSTLAQAHLAFDCEAGSTRARWLPVSGSARLFAKDAAWLSIVAVIAAPYASLPVAVAAVAALTAGHSTVARPQIEQRRGHFASDTLGPAGIFQVLAIVFAGTATIRFGMAAAVLFLGAYALSLFWYGSKWTVSVSLTYGTTLNASPRTVVPFSEQSNCR